MSEQNQQPTIITLDNKNSVEILSSYIDISQKAGVYMLQESDILKRCRDLLLKGVEDPEINVATAKNLFVQAIMKGQSKGCFSLDDASILHKVCTFISTNTDADTQPSTQQVQPAQQFQQVQAEPVNEDDSLSSLSDAVPLKSFGPRTV